MPSSRDRYAASPCALSFPSSLILIAVLVAFLIVCQCQPVSSVSSSSVIGRFSGVGSRGPMDGESAAANRHMVRHRIRQPSTSSEASLPYAVDSRSLTNGEAEQAAALMAFYAAMAGDSWTENSGWGTNSSYCSWHGVGCDPSNNSTVTSLTLIENNLVGTLDSSLSTLTSLATLDLATNPGIIGTVDMSWTALVNLSNINFRQAQLNGSFPVVLCSLPSLGILDISSNQLTGELPDCIGNMPALWILYVSRNSLTGTIPATFALLSKLNIIDVSHNLLVGGLETLVDLPALQVVFAHHDRWTGALPLDLLSSNQLVMVDLSYNAFQYIDCAGYLSAMRKSQLEQVVLSHNVLNDSMVDAITCLGTIAPNITWLDLSHNNLTWDGQEFPAGFPIDFMPFMSALQSQIHSLFQCSCQSRPMAHVAALCSLRGHHSCVVRYQLDLSYNALSGSVQYFVSNMSA